MLRSYRFLIVFVFLAVVMASPAIAGESGRAYFDFGVFALEENAFEGAMMNFEKAIALEPGNGLYHHYLGRTYFKTDHFDKARFHLEKARRIDPTLSGLAYDIGFLHYRTKDYGAAIRRFEDVIAEEPENVLAHYYCGISLYREKEYRRATSRFIAAADMSPTLKANGYYYAGICSIQAGDYETAIERLDFVKQNADSALLRSQADKWLKSIEAQKKELKPYRLFVKAGYQYDSNVTLDPVDVDRVSDEDDFLGVGYFSGSYNLINRKNVVFGAGYNHYQTWHNRLQEYDLIGSVGSIYARYLTGPLTFSLTYHPHYYWLDGDSYLRRHQIMPEVTWRTSAHLITRLSYSYFDNEYFRDDERDGHSHDPWITTYYFLDKRRGYFFGALGYEDNHAAHPDQDYRRFKIRGGLSIEVPWDIILNISGHYQRKDYDNVDSGYGIEREDDKYTASLMLSRPIFFDWLNIVGEYSFTKNNSNISLFEYRRHMATISLTTTF